MTADEIQPSMPGAGEASADAGARSIWDNFRDVVLEPSATFEEVGRMPRWVAPLIVIMAATLVTSLLLMPFWIETQELAMMRRDLPPEQREQALRMMATFKWVGLAVGPIIAGLFTAVYALFFWAWGAISGGKNASFKIAFAALLYAGVILVFQSIAQAVVVWVKGAEQVAREGQPTFGLALFIERGDMSRWLWGLISDVNFFTIWHAVVVAVAGIYALRMSKGSAYTFAIVVWLVNVIFFALQAPPAG